MILAQVIQITDFLTSGKNVINCTKIAYTLYTCHTELSMENKFFLGKSDVLFERPFTHPWYISADRALLCQLIDELRDIVSTSIHPQMFFLPDRERWQKRIVITDAARLRANKKLTVVGFFGHKHISDDPAIEEEIRIAGQQLINCFRDFPDVVGYVTVLLADGRNFANLVLTKREETITQWRTAPLHCHAAETLSPVYYENVRIYNGILPVGLIESAQLRLTSVKYWDYQSTPTWHAVRKLERLS